MKKLFLAVGLFIVMTMTSMPVTAQEVISRISLELVDVPIKKDSPRMPVNTPNVGISESTLYFYDALDFSVNIYREDENGELILEYSVFVPAETIEVTLPTTLSGTYVIEVVRGEQHFRGEIEM